MTTTAPAADRPGPGAAARPTGAASGCARCTRAPGGCGRPAWPRPRAARPTRCCSGWCWRSPATWSPPARTNAPWSRAYGFYLRMGIVVVAIRVVFAALFGAPVPGHVLFTLPEVTLPDWAAGVRLGGEVTVEGGGRGGVRRAAAGHHAGLRGRRQRAGQPAAAAARRAGRALRGRGRRGGRAVLHPAAGRGRDPGARRPPAARAGRHTGLRGLRGVAMPVLEGALERSVELAAAMDARGFGRTATAGRRRCTAPGRGAVTLAGLLGVCAGLYGLLDAQSPVAARACRCSRRGGGAATVGLWLGGRRSARSRYRPDPWGLPGVAGQRLRRRRRGHRGRRRR